MLMMLRSGVRPLVMGLALVLSVALAPAVAAQDRATPAEPDSSSFAEAFERLRFAVLEVAEAVEDALAAESEEDGPMARVVRSGPRSSGAVALTFDDGHDSRACARIARTLRRNGAVGTFFINGNHLKAEPELWRWILKGMPVGNHTRSHLDLTEEVDRVVRKQIRENEAIHRRLLGRPMLRILRPSYGAFGPRIRRIAAELGYEHIALWSVDTHDWKSSSSAKKIARRATGARPGSVILMHCSRGATAKALPSIIRHYRGRGIKLAGLQQVLEPQG